MKIQPPLQAEEEVELPAWLVGGFGVFSTLLCVLGLLCIVLLCYSIRKLQLLHSATYLAFTHLQALQVYHLIVALTHITPELFEVWYGNIETPEWLEYVVAYSNQLFWYMSSSSYLLLAVTRFIATCRPLLYRQYATINNVIIYLGASWVISGLLVGVPAAFGVCCPRSFDYHIDHDELEGGETDHELHSQDVLNYILQVINISTILIIILCYSLVIVKVRKSTKKAHPSDFVGSRRENNANAEHTSTNNNISEEGQRVFQKTAVLRQRQQQQNKLSLQFLVLSCMFILLCIFLLIIQFVARTELVMLGLHLFYVLSACSDSAVMLFLNDRIRKKVKTLLFGVGGRSQVAAINLNQNAVRRNPRPNQGAH